ncbi:MAG: hypothetical protein ABI237_12595 [Ginsengibacter sp.]
MIAILFFINLFWISNAHSQLFIGTATTDITPPLPVALLGQFHLRIAHTVESPLTANVVALESIGNNTETVIFVSCDLTVIPPSLIKLVRNQISERVTGLDANKIILTATHTHTAPVLGNENLVYPIPPEIMQIDTTLKFVAERISTAIEKAWKTRQPGSVTWGLSYAAIGYNRRSVYGNGVTSLYGGADIPLYRNAEGAEDHDVNTLFFWNNKNKLIAVNISIACPAQEVENRDAINADFWHEARINLRKRFGKDLCILGWVAAAGDQSPHLIYRKDAEKRMEKLRNVSRMQEIGRRIGLAVQEAYDVVKGDRHSSVVLQHVIDTIYLPMRKIGASEYAEAKIQYDNLSAQIAAQPKKADTLQAQMLWYQAAINRFEKQYTNPTIESEIHVIRIGDIVVCTNPYELFTEYGIRIQGRSKALQTFVVQLAGASNYLTTEKAEKNGGYGVIMQSSLVGAEGGQMLVDHTVELINKMWDEGRMK